MKHIGLKLLAMAILLVLLVAPAHAVVASLANASDAPQTHCMQSKDQHSAHQVSVSGDCCQQAKVCDEASCNQCQSCATMVMLVNLHRHATSPTLVVTPLVHIADYLQGIPPQSLYPPHLQHQVIASRGML